MTNDKTTVVAPGSLIASKYLVERVIGAGGMGIILAAKHVQLDQRVAIKVLMSTATSLDVERAARFLREAKAAALIQSKHVVHVFDFGSMPSGAPFLVMEHLEGSDLAGALKTKGGLPIADAVEYILQACEGVAEAHLLGIIHRDLKPANLFLTRKKDGSPAIKVLDFGASKLMMECSLAASDAATTHETALIGSPRYMAPEQLTAGQTVDSRVDVYALGATLYELIAGKPVFVAESIPLTFTKILRELPAPLRDARSDVPRALETVILRALAKTPEARFSSVEELAAALAPFAPERSKTVLAQIARRGGDVPMVMVPRRPRGLAMGIGMAVLVSATTIFFLARRAPVVTSAAAPAPTSPQQARAVAEELAPPSALLPAAETSLPPPPPLARALAPHLKKAPKPSGSAAYSKFGDRQ